MINKFKIDENFTKETQWINNLRALATVAVIILHSSYEILPKFNEVPLKIWWVGNIFDGVMRFCVPIFLMITGALIIPKTDELSFFLKKRFSRILIPFMFWSIIYIIGDLLFTYFIKKELLSFNEILESIFHKIRYGSAGHLWYIYMLIGVYLFIPIIGRWARTCEKKELEYFLIIWFITLFAKIPLISTFSINIDLINFTGYIGYVVFGYYLSSLNIETNSKVKKISLYAIFIGLFITLYGTYYLTDKTNSFVNIYYDYLSPNVLLVSGGIFLFTRYTKLRNLYLLKVINLISNYSYGIYLIHILILQVFRVFGFDWEFCHPLLSVPFVSIGCLLLSTFSVYFINKLPYGQYISK